MRKILSVKAEVGRVLEGTFASTLKDGPMGAFEIAAPTGRMLRIISSGIDTIHMWEHVSVSLSNRPPSWAEMCFVKDLFWGEQECVVQYHRPRSEYVNHRSHCLHLWRQIGKEFPMPPSPLWPLCHDPG
jgi:hypothetical protein